MREALRGLTTRGRSFLAAAAAAGISALILGERDLLRVAVLLAALPLLAAAYVGRSRYKLACTRSLEPGRAPVGSSARVILRLQNMSRLPTGTLLLEDKLPYALGSRPRVVLERLGAHGVFNEIRRETFDEIASANCIGQIEALVEVDTPVAILADSFAGLDTVLVDLIDSLVGVERRIGRRVGRAHAESPVACFHGNSCTVPNAHAAFNTRYDAGRVIALAVIAHHAAEYFVNRQLQGLATNVPQREIKRADAICFFPAGRIEKRAIHILPQAFNVLRIFADQPPSGLLERIS